MIVIMIVTMLGVKGDAAQSDGDTGPGENN